MPAVYLILTLALSLADTLQSQEYLDVLTMCVHLITQQTKTNNNRVQEYIYSWRLYTHILINYNANIVE